MSGAPDEDEDELARLEGEGASRKLTIRFGSAAPRVLAASFVAAV